MTTDKKQVVLMYNMLKLQGKRGIMKKITSRFGITKQRLYQILKEPDVQEIRQKHEEELLKQYSKKIKQIQTTKDRNKLAKELHKKGVRWQTLEVVFGVHRRNLMN